MHPKVKQALEEIDAAVFNGDAFLPREDGQANDDRDELIVYIRRWFAELETTP